jgi:hypothetical protein
MGQASHADFLFAEAVDAWMDVYERHSMPDSVRHVVAPNLRSGFPAGGEISPTTIEGVSAIATAAAMVWPSLGYSQYCKTEVQSRADSQVARDCRQIGKLMAQGTSLSERAIGLALLRSSGGDDPEAQRQLEWLQWHFVSHGTELLGNSAEFDRYLEDLRSTRSEIRAIELLLERHGISIAAPDGWKKPSAKAALAG